MNKKYFDKLIMRYAMYDKMEIILKKDKTTFEYELHTITNLKNKLEKSIMNYLEKQDPEDIFDLLEESINKIKDLIDNL